MPPVKLPSVPTAPKLPTVGAGKETLGSRVGSFLKGALKRSFGAAGAQADAKSQKLGNKTETAHSHDREQTKTREDNSQNVAVPVRRPTTFKASPLGGNFEEALVDSGKQIAGAIQGVETTVAKASISVSRRIEAVGTEHGNKLEAIASSLEVVLRRKSTVATGGPGEGVPTYKSLSPEDGEEKDKDDPSGLPWWDLLRRRKPNAPRTRPKPRGPKGKLDPKKVLEEAAKKSVKKPGRLARILRGGFKGGTATKGRGGYVGVIGGAIAGAALESVGEGLIGKIFGTEEEQYAADVKKHGRETANEMYHLRNDSFQLGSHVSRLLQGKSWRGGDVDPDFVKNGLTDKADPTSEYGRFTFDADKIRFDIAGGIKFQVSDNNNPTAGSISTSPQAPSVPQAPDTPTAPGAAPTSAPAKPALGSAPPKASSKPGTTQTVTPGEVKLPDGTKVDIATADPYEIAKKFKGKDQHLDREELRTFMKQATGSNIEIDPLYKDRLAWCGAFVAATLAASGRAIPKNPNLARAYLDYGTATDNPEKGKSLVVTKRGNNPNQGHVGHFDGFEMRNGEQRVRILGGNTSKKVGVSYAKPEDVLGYRNIPDPVVPVPSNVAKTSPAPTSAPVAQVNQAPEIIQTPQESLDGPVNTPGDLVPPKIEQKAPSSVTVDVPVPVASVESGRPRPAQKQQQSQPDLAMQFSDYFGMTTNEGNG